MKNILKFIFSIKKDGIYTIITVFGIRITLKHKVVYIMETELNSLTQIMAKSVEANLRETKRFENDMALEIQNIVKEIENIKEEIKKLNKAVKNSK